MVDTTQSLNSIDLDQARGGNAINFITFNKEDGFQVTQEAIDFLQSLGDEKVGVIAVAGKYRTGKSFLLNRILLQAADNEGFGVGPSINPCTKGLWIWDKPIELTCNQTGSKYKCLIVDSEGIGAFNEDQNHDTRIFLLSLLLSSYFVYNSMGTIDENALQNLSLIVNLSKEIQIKSRKIQDGICEDPEELARYFPSFMWVVRDFSLKLLDTYGNQINSKQYLENALQEQRGSSDAIENKNRIRRLIKNFFLERDCSTMVRPTEEEKDLQKLQGLDDGNLRPEFVRQMQQLRMKVYRRVKPKAMNGKIITARTLSELAVAYTSAINEGSVPCIESAWTYICKNECQRGVHEAIQMYKDTLKEAMGGSITFTQLKAVHQEMLETAQTRFKEKAIGEDLKIYEKEIKEEIQKQFAAAKNSYNESSKKAIARKLQPEIQAMESDIRFDKITSEGDLKERLVQIRKDFEEGTKEIDFKEKSAIIDRMVHQLEIKGTQALFIQQKQNASNQVVMLKNEVKMLKEDLKEQKNDSEKDRQSHQEAYAKIVQDSRKVEVSLQSKLMEMTENCRSAENKMAFLESEYQKNGALSEQKLFYIEKENADLKSKLGDAEHTISELTEKLSAAEAKVVSMQKMTETTLKMQEKQFSGQKRKEILEVKETYESQIKELKERLDSAADIKSRQDQEKLMQEKIDETSKKQAEEMVKMQQQLMQAISSKSQGDESAQLAQKQKEYDELLKTNNSLSESLTRAEDRNKVLDQKISAIKIHQRVFKHSLSMQCKFCHVFSPADNFINHVKTCNKDTRSSRSQFFQIPLQVSIKQSQMMQDQLDQRTYTEYLIEVNFNGSLWQIGQKYKAFCDLHESLISTYPSTTFPESSYQFASKSLKDFDLRTGTLSSGGSSVVEDRRKNLSDYLTKLVLIPVIKESAQVKQFLGITQKFPEFSDAYQPSIVPKESGRQTQSANVVDQNPIVNTYKIIGEMFKKKDLESVPKEERDVSPIVQEQLPANKKVNRFKRLNPKSSAEEFNCDPVEDYGCEEVTGTANDHMQVCMINSSPPFQHGEQYQPLDLDEVREGYSQFPVKPKKHLQLFQQANAPKRGGSPDILDSSEEQRYGQICHSPVVQQPMRTINMQNQFSKSGGGYWSTSPDMTDPQGSSAYFTQSNQRHSVAEQKIDLIARDTISSFAKKIRRDRVSRSPNRPNLISQEAVPNSDRQRKSLFLRQ